MLKSVSILQLKERLEHLCASIPIAMISSACKSVLK
jgi:hypothetical protein